MTSVVFTSPVCSSDTNPSLTCTVIGNQIQVTNLNYYTANQPINITISSIYVPTAQVTIGDIAVSGLKASVEMATATISIPGSSFTTDIPRKLTVTPTYQSNNKVDVQISFLLSHQSMISDKIEVTFPSDFTISSSLGDYSILGSNTLTTPSITFNTTFNSFSFNPFSIDSITRASLTVTVRNLVRPR